jgi:hypothetical protein
MEKYLRLFAALERIFGKGYVSRLMGKQSNVITLPDKQARKFLDTELNVMEASEGAVKKGVQDLNNLVSDTKRLSTLNDQELLTITNNAERLAVKVNPPAPPPAPTADVLSITTKVNKNKDPNVLIDEYNKNQTRLRLTDDEGGTAISYDEFRKLQSRNNEIEKTLESLNVKPALDEVKPEGIVIPFTKKTEDFATGGRVGMAGGGILKLAMKFFNDNNPVSAYKKYLKYVKETAQKDPAKLAPEVGGIVVGSELIHRGLRRKLKEVKEKNNENDSENIETDNRTEKAGGGVSQGLDYLTGIERRGYANGDYAVQAGIKNYLGKQKTATVPIKWKSGKDHPDTELAYITKPEKELLIKLDLHGSMKDGKPNKGPGEIISLNSGGSGNGGSGDGGSGGGGTDTGDMGSEAANNAATDSANASAGIGGGPTDTGDLGSEAANNAATAAAAASVGMGTFSPYSRPGMIAKNISNYMMGNPTTSIGLTALGSMLGIPGLGVMNAASSIYGGGRSSSSIGSGQGEDGSGDGEDGRDGRTFIPSFDTTLLTPDLAKNRDYRLYQGANNPFYSMQAVPSGGINNVYTEFQTGGRVGFKKGSFLINTAIDAAKNLSKKKSKKELKRQLTDDEIDDLAAEVGDLDAYLDFDGTVGSAEKIRKQHKEYMDYMYYQYKTGRLDPKPGEMNTSRMQYLRNKRKQAEMTDDPKLFNPNERDELDNLEETFSPMGTSNKINISDPKTAESFTEFAKQNDPEGFKKIEKIVDDINNKNTLENFDITGRKKNAKGGEESLNDLFELERQGKITREDMNVYSPRYLEYLDAQIINKEKLYTPKEWEKTPDIKKQNERTNRSRLGRS